MAHCAAMSQSKQTTGVLRERRFAAVDSWVLRCRPSEEGNVPIYSVTVRELCVRERDVKVRATTKAGAFAEAEEPDNWLEQDVEPDYLSVLEVDSYHALDARVEEGGEGDDPADG